jgi:hypothetical protein
VRGGLSVAGGDLRLLGRVDGYVLATGGSVLIDGPVTGDVEVRAGQVELGPAARIGGKLRYASRRPLLRSASASVAGGIESVSPESGWPVPADLEERVGRAGSWIWSVGILVLALVLAGAVPGVVATAAKAWRTRFGLSALIGVLGVACTPVAAVLLFVTLVGVPLGLLLILAVAILAVAGYAMSGIAIGDWALQRVRGAADSSTTWRLAAAAFGVLLLSLLARIPVLGAFVMLVALVTGAGAIVLGLSGVLRPPAPPAAARQA